MSHSGSGASERGGRAAPCGPLDVLIRSKPRLTPMTSMCVSRRKGPGEGTVVLGKSTDMQRD